MLSALKTVGPNAGSVMASYPMLSAKLSAVGRPTMIRSLGTSSRRFDACVASWLRRCHSSYYDARMHLTPHNIQTPNGAAVWALAKVLWLVVGQTSLHVHDAFSTVHRAVRLRMASKRSAWPTATRSATKMYHYANCCK